MMLDLAQGDLTILTDEVMVVGSFIIHILRDVKDVCPFDAGSASLDVVQELLELVSSAVEEGGESGRGADEQFLARIGAVVKVMSSTKGGND